MIYHNTMTVINSHDMYNLYPYYKPGAFLPFGTLEAVFSSVLSLRLCYDTARWKTGRTWRCGLHIRNWTHEFQAKKKWLHKYRDDSWPHFMAVN